jgi:hypothetical protein
VVHESNSRLDFTLNCILSRSRIVSLQTREFLVIGVSDSRGVKYISSSAIPRLVKARNGVILS